MCQKVTIMAGRGNYAVSRAPSKLYKKDIPDIDTIIKIMLESASKGGFFDQLPAKIFYHTDCLVGIATLYRIQDPLFIEARAVAISMCFDFWSDEMHKATIQPSVWIWITKAMLKWKEDRTIQIELTKDVKDTQDQIEERRKKLRDMIIEVTPKHKELEFK